MRRYRWSTMGAALVALACLSLTVTACERAPEAPQGSEGEPAPEDTAAEDERERTRGDAFGLPLPPRVLTVYRTEVSVKVTTDMTMAELDRFLRKNLIDYEFLSINGAVRAVPLRDHMPIVQVTRPYGPQHPRQVFYALPQRAVKARAATSGAPKGDARGERAEVASARQPAVKRKRGAPVELRTSKGELLAPGARWGVPYTPPPGTPLHKEKNRHNFGRPFGQWIPN